MQLVAKHMEEGHICSTSQQLDIGIPDVEAYYLSFYSNPKCGTSCRSKADPRVAENKSTR